MHERTANTTPESLELHRIFRKMADAGCQCVCMEVSSQGLMAGRVDDIFFDLGVFTNLSPDHIGPGEHKDFDDYRRWKAALFTRCRAGLFNADDPNAECMMRGASCEKLTFGFGQDCDYRAEQVMLSREPDALGVRFVCRRGSRARELALCQPGRFSVYNGLAAFAAAEWMGVPDAMAAAALALARVPGRIEIVPAIPGATFIVDFAHNEASLKAILETVREYTPKRLVCLFGSVGDRSQLRRAGLARIASELCDYAILTSDNPGFEDPSAIIADIEHAMTLPADRFVSIPDRTAAVKFAVDFAREGDIIVFAGKGHEDYQLVRGEKVPFSERRLIAQFAAQRLAR